MDDEQRENLKKPSSAPAVPKELLSARPAMTKIRPQAPDPAAEANESIKVPEPTPEEVAERQERIDYLKNLRAQNKKPKKGGKKKWLIALIVLLVLAAVAAGAFMLLKKPKETSKTTNQTTPTNQPANTEPVTQDQTAEMKTYDSTNFALSFKYPADWTVNDTSTGLTVISPKTTLKDADGEDAPAAVVLHIRPKQTSIPEFKSGNAAAVLTSKNIAYTAPATGQRGNTYLSFVQYASTTATGALDSIYITGNAGYQKGQNIPMKDVAKVDPLINVSFVDCSKACTPTSLAISVSAASWSENSLNQTVETMLRSLSIN